MVGLSSRTLALPPQPRSGFLSPWLRADAVSRRAHRGLETRNKAHHPHLRRLTRAAKRLPHVAACFSLRTGIADNGSIATPRYVVEPLDNATSQHFDCRQP